MGGTLYLVSTPIGNLEDVTQRALRVLKEVSVIACEDTRVSRKLLDAYAIKTPTISFHAHSSEERPAQLLSELSSGRDVAYICDAGTPLVSDPGALLVEQAIAEGIQVVPIPGCSALTGALPASGLFSGRVIFLGFLPRSAGERREILSPLRGLAMTLVLYESPHRVRALAGELISIFGDRKACLAWEITKRFERFERGRLSQIKDVEAPPKGEVVLMIGPSEVSSEVPNPELHRLRAKELVRAGQRPADAARALAGAFGLAKKEAYRLVMEAQKESGDELANES